MVKRHQSNPRNTTKNEGEDKHMNTTNGSGVGCEIELPDGRLCRVATLGRCATCGRAFCLTHQGRYYNYSHQLVPYVDMCAPCAAVKQAEEARRQEEARAPYEYFESGAARTALLTSGVPSVKIYSVHSEWKTGLFGLGGRNVDVATPGWILGQFKWKYSVPVGDSESKQVVGDWLTALLDLSHDDQLYKALWINTNVNKGLFRVQPYSRGYRALGLGFTEHFVGSWQSGEGWRELAQAVKRLTGESS